MIDESCAVRLRLSRRVQIYFLFPVFPLSRICPRRVDAISIVVDTKVFCSGHSLTRPSRQRRQHFGLVISVYEYSASVLFVCYDSPLADRLQPPNTAATRRARQEPRVLKSLGSSGLRASHLDLLYNYKIKNTHVDKSHLDKRAESPPEYVPSTVAVQKVKAPVEPNLSLFLPSKHTPP